MKFAKSLVKNEVPEWSQYYIDYKDLKRLVKQAQANLQIYEGNPDSDSKEAISKVSTPFFNLLDRTLDEVDNFYNSKLAEYSRRFRHIQDRHTDGKAHTDDPEHTIIEREDLIALLLELRGKFRKLQWYAEINNRGFTKILKKFEKKVGPSPKSQYFYSKLPIMGFSKFNEVSDKIDATDKLLKEIIPNFDPNSQNPTYTSQSLDSSQPSVNAELKEAIRQDDDELAGTFLHANDVSRSQLTWLILYAVSERSAKVIPELIVRYAHYLVDSKSSASISSLASDDLRQHNIIQKVVISEGRHHLRSGQDRLAKWVGYEGTNTGLNSRDSSPLDEDDKESFPDYESALMIRVVLKCVGEFKPLSSLLVQVDHQLCTALHYAIKYDLVETTKLLLESDTTALEFEDADGMTPLELAVVNKNPYIVETLLKANPGFVKPSLLQTAVRLNLPKVCDVLISIGHCDVDYQSSESKETALHLAVRKNNRKVVEVLLKNNASTEIKEESIGWTPLFIAAADGLIDIAKLLLSYGADTTAVDKNGWFAKEHAALRGHFKLAQEIPSPESLPHTPPSTLDHKHNTLDLTFGHKFLKDTSEHLILVTLGSKDLRLEECLPVQLDEMPHLEFESSLNLRVSATHSSSEPYLVDLPTPSLGLATEPIPFFTKEPLKTRIVFDLVSSFDSNKVIARGVYNPPVRHRLQDLNNCFQSVPIIQASDLKIMGQINFELLVVTPFVHPNNGIEVSASYWRSLIKTRVIGHRGLGKNTLEQNNLQVGENTVESFIQAGNLGASYVEFDVQLTKDNVPVIYHDFLVGDSGFDIPMHAMTYDQFMNIQEPSRGRSRDRTPPGANFARHEDNSGAPKRSHSVHTRSEDLAPVLEDTMNKMRYTRDYKTKGFKGNVRGLHIQSKFATLEELFKTLPENLGFNIEFKYAMLDEAEAEDLDGTMFEINHYVDTLLKVIFDLKKNRDIILSSFNPDICILLKLKQPTIPILFLTESGTCPMMDIRASSLQEAIRFAKQFNLLGIVSEATPLVMCPRLISAVKETGLVCFTYGTANNKPENARLQLAAGVDAVIVDSVYKIKEELKDSTPDDILVQELSKAVQATHIN